MQLRLPPLLEEGLDVVFVGTEPGGDSLRRGACPRNAFYAHLAEAGFTPRPLTPTAFRSLLDYGIGLDDVYDKPDALRLRIEAVRPRAVCFNNAEALRRFAGVARLRTPWRREAAARYADFSDSLVWATGDSSWMASRHWASRLADLRALREQLDGVEARRDIRQRK